MKWAEFTAALLFIGVGVRMFLVDLDRFWRGHECRLTDAIHEYTAPEPLVPEWAREMFEAIDRLPETAGAES